MAMPIFSQTLSISADVDSARKETVLTVSLADTHSTLTAIQWDLISPEQLKVAAGSAELEAGLKEAGKTLHCANHPGDDPKAIKQVCLLVGGQKTLPDGTIAKVHVSIPAGTGSGKYSIELRQAEGVTSNGKRVSLKGSPGVVTIP